MYAQVAAILVLLVIICLLNCSKKEYMDTNTPPPSWGNSNLKVPIYAPSVLFGMRRSEVGAPRPGVAQGRSWY
jgi:hypothetical protein